MVIVYCQACGVRVTEGDLQSGAAAQDAQGNTFCPKCTQANLTKRPPSRVMAPVRATPAQAGSRDSRTSRAVIPAAHGSGRETAPAQPPSGEPELAPLSAGPALDAKPKSFNLAVAVGVGGLVFFLGALYFTLSRTDTPSAPGPAADGAADAGSAALPTAAQSSSVPASRPGETAPATASAEPSKNTDKEPEKLRADRAARLLEEAKAFARQQPQEVRQIRGRFAAVTATYPGTPASDEAARLLAELPAEAEAETQPPGQNLLADPGLESGKWGPWQSWGGAQVVRELDNAHSGAWCVRLNPGRAGCGQKVSGLVPNTNYLVTGWGKTGKDDSFIIGAKEYGGPERSQSITKQTYERVSVTFATGAANTTASVFCYRGGGKSYGYCDDFCLVAQGPVSPEQVAAAQAAAPAPPAQPAQPVQPSATAAALLTEDRAWQAATDLLPLLDLEKDASPNVWKMQGSSLQSDKCPQAKLHLPYEPATEYDLRVSFTRHDGNDTLVQYLTGGAKAFVWVLSVSGNTATGLSQVAGRGSNDNPSTAKCALQNGRKHTSVIQVRSDGVTAFLDGKPLIQWKTDFKDMSLPGQWKMHSDTALGLGSQNCKVTYHSIEVLDMSGKGKALRAPRAPATAVQTPEAKPETAGALPRLTAAEDAKAEYEKTAADVYALLSKDGLPAARARLDKAKAEPRLAPVGAALALDAAFAQYVDDLRTGALAGAALLVDKRPFTFVKADGKQTKVGKGSTIAVTGVKDDDIQIEEAFGGGKVQAKIELAHLGPFTRYELARFGLPAEPERELRLAFAAFLLLQSGAAEVTLKQVRSHLEAARKAQAPAEKANHLAERLAFHELEQGAEAAYRKIDGLLQDKKWEEAKAFIVDFRKEHLGTKAWEKLQPAIVQHLAEIEAGLSPLKPGLWASYWSGDGGNKFKTFHLGRAETTLKQNWGNGSPDPKVPADNFGACFRGLLRIEKEGRYAFQGSGDDWMQATLDGKKVGEGNKAKDTEITLAKGDHEIVIKYTEGGGSANLSFRWKPEGAGDLQEIPASALWHDSRQTAKYEQQK